MGISARRITVLAAGGLLALLFLAGIAALLSVYTNARKPLLEEAASDALGMEVRIDGRVGIEFFPVLRLSARGVRIRNRGGDVASAREAVLRIELTPLFRRELRIADIAVRNPRIAFVRDRDGTFNFVPAGGKAAGKVFLEREAGRLALSVGAISLRDGTFSYSDAASGEHIEAEGFDAKVRDLAIPEGYGADHPGSVSFTADLACRELRRGNLAAANVRLRIAGKNGGYAIGPLAADRLLYSDPGGDVTAERIVVRIDRLGIDAEGGTGLARKIRFEGGAEVGKVNANRLEVSGLEFGAAWKGGIVDIEPVTMRIFGGRGSGSLRADLSGSVPVLRIRYSLARFRIEDFLETLSPGKMAGGPMDFTATLSMRGRTIGDMVRTAEGSISLRGEDLAIAGIDLDREFGKYESGLGINIVDIGAYFFAGPFGPVLTKGYRFATIYRKKGGTTRIGRLVSDWKADHGVATARDVAMATFENRFALKGRIDFVNERFDDVTVALVDKKGCAKVRQKIRGPFRKPQVEKPSVLRTIAGPVLDVVRQANDLLGGRCDAFYTGSLPPPD